MKPLHSNRPRCSRFSVAIALIGFVITCLGWLLNYYAENLPHRLSYSEGVEFERVMALVIGCSVIGIGSGAVALLLGIWGRTVGRLTTEEKNTAKGFNSYHMVILFSILALGGGGGLVFSLSRGPRSTESTSNRCIYNIYRIAVAKREWAKNNDAVRGRTVETNLLVSDYLDGITPTCPMGGTYEFGEIGQNPWCSLSCGEKEKE